MKYYRYSMNMKKLNIICLLLFIPLFIVIYVMDIFNYMNLTFFLLYLFWMFLHEFIHGFGFSLSNGIKHKNIVYGACLEKGIFYCMCKEKIKKNDIIISLLLPFFLIGIITFFLGLYFNNNILVLLSLFNIVGCVGDLAMFFSFLKLPDFSYVDLDDCTGFVLISDSVLSKYKLFCVDLVEIGNYTNLGVAHEYKKFTISKLSVIIFVLLILFLILDLAV